MSAPADIGVKTGNIKDLGWMMRRADADEDPGKEHGERGWVFFHTTGLKTPPLPSPSAAMKAAQKLEEARQSGQLDDAPAEPADAPPGEPASIPRPARDGAHWLALADSLKQEMTAVNRARRESKKKVWRALSALAKAFDVGELPEVLFGLAERAQVMRLLIQEVPGPETAEFGLMAKAGLDTPGKYGAAHAALLGVVEEFGPDQPAEPEPARSQAETEPTAEAQGEGVGEASEAQAGEDEGDYSRPDADDADTARPADPVEAGAAPSEDFTNPGVGDARGSGQRESEVTFVGRPVPALFEGPGLTGVSESPLVTQIHPSKVTTHPSTLMRAGGLDPDHVEDLRDELRKGRTLPPIDLFHDGVTHWLADGNHRHAAAEAEGAVLDVRVHEGSLRDAILFAVRANADHGLKRTPDDKRLAVVTLLADEEWGLGSDTSVAALADVAQPFVGKVQHWLVRLLPQLEGDGVEDPSDVPDEEFAERADVPAGLVSAVRSLTDAQLKALAHNVMARAESRVTRDGKTVRVARAEAPEPPSLFRAEEPEEAAGGVPARVSPAEAQEPAGEALEGEAEGERSSTSAEAPEAGPGRPEAAADVRRAIEEGRTREPSVPATPRPQVAAPTTPASFPAEELTLVINVKAGKSPARGLTLSGRVAAGAPVWVTNFTLADLEPVPPPLAALLSRMAGGDAAPKSEAQPPAPAPKKKSSAKGRAAAKGAPKKAEKGGAKPKKK